MSAPLPIQTAKSHARSDSMSQSAAKLESLLHAMHSFSVDDELSPLTPMTPTSTTWTPTSSAGVPIRRSRSATRMAAVGCSATLAELQASSASLSAHFHKLHAAQEDSWKLRFVLLTQEDGNLYLFKNNSPTSLPITFLPLVSCSGILETQANGDTAYILRVQGDGRTADGMLVKRSWVLHCTDEVTLSMWVHTISRILDHKHMAARAAAAATAAPPMMLLGTSPYMDQRSLSLSGAKPYLVRNNSKYSVDSSMTGGSSSPPSLYAGSAGRESWMEAQRMHEMWLQKEAEDRELAELDARFQREMAEHKASMEDSRPKSVGSDKSDDKKKVTADKARKRVQAQMAAGYIMV
ncbi:hypothetical protein BJ741DRAFT_603475 [Chytriomyces cf. hyalinus JEL632]|nr:hypothetical protein BJ741DRAFT_603475 [Chytriomyces cf. hyalinus JEL632]